MVPSPPIPDLHAKQLSKSRSRGKDGCNSRSGFVDADPKALHPLGLALRLFELFGQHEKLLNQIFFIRF